MKERMEKERKREGRTDNMDGIREGFEGRVMPKEGGIRWKEGR